MAHSKSRLKTIRQVKFTTIANKSKKTALKTFEKKFLVAVAEGNKEEATTLLTTVSSSLDKMAKTNTIHKSKADRKKSRLAIAFNKAFTA